VISSRKLNTKYNLHEFLQKKQKALAMFEISVPGEE
jgi:hypothetical protein